MENKVDIIFWRIGLREVYSLGIIGHNEFLYMYDRNFIYKEDLTAKEADIIEFISSLIADTESFAQLVNEEMAFIFGANVPEDKRVFRKHWMFHLAECLEEEHIDKEDFSNLYSSIDFTNSDWTEIEKTKVFSILDMLRINMLARVPASIEFFENPSFEVLMFANKLDASE